MVCSRDVTTVERRTVVDGKYVHWSCAKKEHMEKWNSHALIPSRRSTVIIDSIDAHDVTPEVKRCSGESRRDILMRPDTKCSAGNNVVRTDLVAKLREMDAAIEHLVSTS